MATTMTIYEAHNGEILCAACGATQQEERDPQGRWYPRGPLTMPTDPECTICAECGADLAEVARG